jgi:hypothetical protein
VVRLGGQGARVDLQRGLDRDPHRVFRGFLQGIKGRSFWRYFQRDFLSQVPRLFVNRCLKALKVSGFRIEDLVHKNLVRRS